MNEMDKTNLSDQTKFRLNEVSKIENYFKSEINQRKLRSKKLSKYVSALNYIDKILSVLNATTGGACIISHATVVGAPLGIASAEFFYCFFISNRNNKKKLLKTARNKKKKHDKILMLVKSKLNTIETLVSGALIEMEISHKEFITIFKEKDKYEKMKEYMRNLSEKLEKKQENIRINSLN